MSEQHTGSCLCGGFKYMVKNPSKVLLNCHCGMCKKATGAAFVSGIVFSKDDIFLLETSTISSFKSSENAIRYFCNRCGCSVYAEEPEYPDIIGMYAGTLDCDPGIKVCGEAYTKYKAPWHVLNTGAPNSEEGEILLELTKML